jgi:16S rRNA processing protein RimM
VPLDLRGRVTLARIVRTRGLRGEVAAEILTDFPERLTQLKAALLWDGRGEPRPVGIRKCWLSPSRGWQVIFLFAGVDSIEEAEKLRGLEVQVSLEERVKLSPGRYYVSELVGCEVFERGAPDKPPERIGAVRDVQFTGAAPLLEVETAHGDLLIPLAEEICTRIDAKTRRIEVLLPEGLRDLNS